MKQTRILLCLSLVFGALLSARAMNNADVIKMKQAGLSDNTILLSMDKQSAEYDTSAGELVKLKEAGVPEPIIQKMLTLGSGKPVTSAGASDPAAAAAPAPAAVAPAPAAAAAPAMPSWGEMPSIAPAMIDPVVGQNYFTRFTLMTEKGAYNTTNYSRGDLVPINTEVQLVSMSGKNIVLKRVDNSTSIKVENVPDYTKKTLPELAKIMLAAEKTPVEKLPPAITTAINSGQMRLGMTKEQVLMARGYPPAHETPSTDGDRWVYWSSRFVKLTVLFTDGHLSQGRGIN